MREFDKATPRPWVAKFEQVSKNFSTWVVNDSKGFEIAEVSAEHDSQIPANARLIVKAVNNYERLLEENESLKIRVKSLESSQ